MTPLTMVLPMPYNRGNSRLHWRVAQKKKQAYYDELTVRMHAGMIPKPPKLWPAFAKVEMTLFVWAKMDRDNLYARCKFPCDWLVAHGYIAGDREDQIDLQVTQKIDRKHQRIQVSISPIDSVVEEAG
jgi:Holliday junction resolvase RusA-like endonuclease